MIHERSTKKVFSQNSRYKAQVLSTEFISWLYSARELQRTWISCSLWHEISFTKRKSTPPYHFSDTERLPSFILMFRWAIPQWIKHFTQDSCMQRYTDVQSKMLKIAIKALRVMQMKHIERCCIINCSFSYKKKTHPEAWRCRSRAIDKISIWKRGAVKVNLKNIWRINVIQEHSKGFLDRLTMTGWY